MDIFNKKENDREEQQMHIFNEADCGAINQYAEVSGVSAQRVINAVKLGDWKEVEALSTSKVDAEAADKLDGLIIKGYETKFGKTNTNGERYEKECLDEFIEQYYIKNQLNIPVTIQHRSDIDHLAGRVLLVEVNSVGFYFVVYIPRTYKNYDAVLNSIKAGILQGMSKEGYVDWEDMDFLYKKDGSFDYVSYKKFRLTAMSIVATPANGVTFEKVAQSVKNAVQFHKETTPKNNAAVDPLKKMFN